MSSERKKSPVALTGATRRSAASRETPENRKQLIDIAKRGIAHVEAGITPSQTDEVVEIPVEHYLDQERWQQEVALFRRIPLMLALGGELRGANSYKAMTVMDTPVLLTRGADNEVRAFVNQCSHRSAIVVPEGAGTARRFACPYHNWTYNTMGDLVGVTDREYFGDFDVSCMGLTPLPVAERAGLIFAVITPGVAMNIDEHLCGYDQVLDFFGFGDWHLVSQRDLAGPNWKIAYDGYLDFYHLPFLHRASFGSDMHNKAIYTTWGPHQRMTHPDPALLELREIPEDEWNLDQICGGVWTIFPHISIAGGNGGGQVAQLFPGTTPGTSRTILNYYVAAEPSDEQRTQAQEQAGFLERVVRDEDYATGLGIQRALASGAKRSVVFGRNEGGGQRFHRALDRYVAGDAAPAQTPLPT
jgi:phenylpropionate dioxygenase-like ring-hydroxylating dioxygenase large terminal subunit